MKIKDLNDYHFNNFNISNLRISYYYLLTNYYITKNVINFNDNNSEIYSQESINYINKFIKINNDNLKDINIFKHYFDTFLNNEKDNIKNVSKNLNKMDLLLKLRIYSLLDDIKNVLKKDILIISNNVSTFIYLENTLNNSINYDINKHNIDFLAYNNDDLKDIQKEYLLQILKNSKNIKNVFNDFGTKISNNMNISKKKYNSIICRDLEFLSYLYLPIYKLTKIPNYLFQISHSLKLLKKNGDLFIFTRIVNLNPCLEKLHNLLGMSFDKIDTLYIYEESMILIKCLNYLDNLNEELINNLINISYKSQKYYYSNNDVLKYLYLFKGDNKFFYQLNDYLNLKTNLHISTKEHYSNLKINILDDIDIKGIENNLLGNNLNDNFKYYFKNYFDTLHYTVYQAIQFKNQKYIYNREYFEKLVNKYLLDIFPIINKFKIPYNRVLFVKINKYNNNVLDQLYSFKNQIIYEIVPYKLSVKYRKEMIGKIKPQLSYHYNEINELQDIWNLDYQVKINLLKDLNVDRTPKEIRDITEDFARGVARMVKSNKSLKIKYNVSNAFMKLWEILSTIDGLIDGRKTKIKVFHIAEAPGQWINTIKYFIEKKRKNIQEYDWRGNTLNPNHPINIEMFGNNIFSDDYGLFKNNPDKWLWGEDETGDIMKIENNIWYRNYISSWGNVDLVTGDAGLYNDNPLITQKLEWSQMCMVASCSSIGSNCIIKHFLSYVRKTPETYYGSGYFVNLIYTYQMMFEKVILIKPMTSNPDSGEFYLVGKNFLGIDDKEHLKLLNTLQKFEVNQCIWKKNEIPIHFYKQVIEFMKSILKLNIEHGEMINTLMTCMSVKDPIIEKETQCKKYLSKEYKTEIQEKKFMEWVKKFEFIT